MRRWPYDLIWLITTVVLRALLNSPLTTREALLGYFKIFCSIGDWAYEKLPHDFQNAQMWPFLIQLQIPLKGSVPFGHLSIFPIFVKGSMDAP